MLGAAGLLLLAACRSPAPVGPQPPAGLTQQQQQQIDAAGLDVRGLSLERATELLAAAQAAAADPDDVDAAIWHGRQLAYCGQFEESVRVYTAALGRLEDRLARLRIAPDALPRLLAQAGAHRILRHRGHRFISLRRFDLAAADLLRAAQLAELVPDRVERDGLPNAAGIPRSTTHVNIHYHLGLAYLLLGRVADAREAWTLAVDLAPNDDMLVATAWWLHCAHLRMGDRDEAAAVLRLVRQDMEILENDTYHRLLLWARGDLPDVELGVTGPDAADLDDTTFATIACGVAMQAFATGERRDARRWFRAARDRSRNAFGAIVAETELSRMADGT